MGKRKKKKADKDQPTDLEKNGNLSDQTLKPKFSVEDLLVRTNEYIESFDFDMAEKFCKKALDLEPENTLVLETYGTIFAEIGDIENAKKSFFKSVELEPESGHLKYLYLGQLLEGREAVEKYEKAILIMKNVIEFEKNNAESETTMSGGNISTVYCSLAELYMTDCCMEENAANKCELFCKEAMEADKNNLDAYIVTCNYKLSLENLSSAKEYVNVGFNLWEETTSKHADTISDIFGYEARVSLIKLLIEVGSCEKVSPIVDQLIEENEDDLRIWYYLGFAKTLLKDPDNPRFYLEKSLDLIQKEGWEEEEHEIVEHINELLEQCPNENEEMDTICEEDENEPNGMETGD